VEKENALVLARAGNWAVMQVPGRRFPAACVQGDTFAGLREQLVGAAKAQRRDPADPGALGELDSATREVDAMLGFYEQVLVDRGIDRPY